MVVDTSSKLNVGLRTVTGTCFVGATIKVNGGKPHPVAVGGTNLLGCLVDVATPESSLNFMDGDIPMSVPGRQHNAWHLSASSRPTSRPRIGRPHRLSLR